MTEYGIKEVKVKVGGKKNIGEITYKSKMPTCEEIEKEVIDELIDNSDPDFRQIANKLSYLTKLIESTKNSDVIINDDSKVSITKAKSKTKTKKDQISPTNNIKKVTMDAFNIIKGLTQNDKHLEINEIIDKIMLPTTSFHESIRLYESDINIISMSFYSNFTENINKLDISNKDKIKSIAQVSEYLVEGEIYSDYYWKNKISSCEIYQGVNHIIAPKFVMNKLVKKDKSKNETKWDFTGKRIFYLNPHIMERFWKISLANQIYSNTHLPYLIELIWNLLKSHKYRSQEKIYKKILLKLFEGGLEIKDFENIYKGFVLGNEDNKENEEAFKELKVILKKYFTDIIYQKKPLPQEYIDQFHNIIDESLNLETTINYGVKQSKYMAFFSEVLSAMKLAVLLLNSDSTAAKPVIAAIKFNENKKYMEILKKNKRNIRTFSKCHIWTIK